MGKILRVVKSKNFLIGAVVGLVVGAGSLASAKSRVSEIASNPKSIVKV